MQITARQRLGLLASAMWVIVSALLASWDETWIAAWRLYCSVSASPACTGDTVFLVIHRGAIATIVIFPLVMAWLVACGLRWRIGRSRRGV